jgi:ectoine hydroxylase-related dioxygenase (phytanoyl-CoA dioxygenase family)
LSLFEDETIDLSLPPLYLTLVVPLVDVMEGDGATEFLPGSHKINLRNIGITNIDQLDSWANTQQSVVTSLSMGSAVLFDGWTVHRGTKTIKKDTACRSALYVVFKKNWYSDDDAADFDYSPT